MGHFSKLLRFVFDPASKTYICFYFEFYDARDVVGMDFFDFLFHLEPIFFFGFQKRHDFLAAFNFDESAVHRFLPFNGIEKPVGRLEVKLVR